MRRRGSVVGLVLGLVVSACGEGAVPSVGSASVATSTVPTVAESVVTDGVATTLPASTTTTTTDPTSTSSTIPGGPGVAIAAVGTVVEDRRGRVICHFQSTGPCPGLPLSGESLPRVGDQVRVTGRYDGASLMVSSVESWTPDQHGPYHNPCTGNTNGDQAPETVLEPLDRVYTTMSDRLVGTWVADGEVVVAFTGSRDTETEEIDRIDGICVVTGYEHSARELQSMVETEISPLLADLGVALLHPDVDAVPDSTIRYEGDAVDASTIELLADRYGDLVEIRAFITVLDAPLSELPQQQPQVPGDIPIPTAGTRSGGGMAALWVGVDLKHDRDLNCLYVGEDDSRTVIVWPYGYTAVAGDPSTIHDPAGNLVYDTATPFDLGGGNGSIDGVDPEKRCGAADAWYVTGPTKYAFLNR